MVARINTGANPAGAVLYNEYKVAHGEARFLGGFNAVAYDQAKLPVKQKINELERYARGNENISKPTFHVSLAFHPSEKFSDHQLSEIGQNYMDRLGYGEQPYLIYRHEDTHHPHIHIVSVSVDFQGKKISDSHQQRRSNAVRQALEKEYGLVEAEKQGKELLMNGLLPEQILGYKEPEAKKAIGNVVRTALTDYNFSNVLTFSEFLHQHRVQMNQLSGVAADGKPYKGITFQLYNGPNDQRGEAIGPAIKASRFAFAPTYERLERKFKQNATRIRSGKEATRQRIHSSLGSYSQLSEADFRTQLRSAGIQVIDTGQQYMYVDHKSRNVYGENELGPAYTRLVQRAAFTDRSVRLDTLQNRVRASSPSTTDQPPRTKRSAGSGEPIKGQSQKTEPTSQELALRRRVSHFYQQVRQQGVDGKKPYFFESQLIRQFPHELLTDLLIEEGVNPQSARQAVTQFEAYKQSQLPEIRSKEEAYFSQTANQFVSLASELPLSAASKRAFLSAADFVLTVDQGTLTHREDAQLCYVIPLSVQKQLQQDQGPSLAFRSRLTKPERLLYGALASGQMPPDPISFYQVSAAHLKAAIGPRFDHVSIGLNKSYANQVSTHLNDQKPLLPQLQARGFVIDALASGAYRMGHYLTRSDGFTPVPDALARRLQKESIPTLADQTQTLKSSAGRSLVSMSQAIDLNNTALMQGELGRWHRQANYSPGSGSVMEQAMRVQIQLQAQLESTAGNNATPEANKAISLPTKPVIPQPVSTVSQDLVRLLQQADLTAQQRYQITTQLGLIWQRTESGQVRLKEGEHSTHPGRFYTLTPSEQTNFSRPVSNELISPRLNAADQALLRAISQGNDFSRLTRQQVASLTLPAVEIILPKPMLPTFQRWYNEQRGSQVLSDTTQQFGEPGTTRPGDARRHLSALYQRGFLIKQEVDSTNRPVFRMGHYKTDPASYVAVPPEIAQTFSRQFPSQPGKNVYVLEGAWPAPDSVAAQRMRSLARAVDSDVEPGRLNKLIERVHDRFPHLSQIREPQLLLDQLVSQPRANRQPTKGQTSGSQPALDSSKPYALSTSSSSLKQSSSSDSLQSLLDRFENQAPQKGLLDILGESASAIRPKKKRVGEATPVRRRGRSH
ncbi:hypothetical protein GCM10028818_57720 [Spirosoma horti]